MKTRILSFLLWLAFFGIIACENQATSTSDEKTAATSLPDSIYLEKGKQIAGATFAVLSKELQSAMESGGVAQAVQYCNLAAYPLTDSLSKVHNAIIRRTSLKARNPNNTPTPEEKVVLEKYQQDLVDSVLLKPIVKQLDENNIYFYAPIVISDLCLKCHGKIGEKLQGKDYEIIKNLYPNDAAIDYESGDLRGMWSIKFVNSTNLR